MRTGNKNLGNRKEKAMSLTDEQIQRFRDWSDEELGYGFTPREVAVTHETVEDFMAACRTITSREDHEMADGTRVVLLTETQRYKGEPRRDLIIADFGSVRAVAAL